MLLARVQREFQYLGLHERSEVLVVHSNQLSVCPGIEADLFVFFKTFCHKDFQSPKIAKGRHSSDLTGDYPAAGLVVSLGGGTEILLVGLDEGALRAGDVLS